MRLGPLVRGLLTFVPIAALQRRRPGHTGSAEYCYSVWLKHLVLLRANGLQSTPPTVAELGPGHSIGVGLAALLSGAKHYVGLDVARDCNVPLNLRILDDLVELFRARAPRPDKGWPNFNEYLDENLFPSHILTPELLEWTLAPDRIARIKDALTGERVHDSPTIRYMAPWFDPAVVKENSIDLAISHSVLEHVVDVKGTYEALYAWLKPGAWTSHQIGMTSHGLSKEWNGYWTYSEPLWKMMLGRRPYLINREPCSVHRALIEQAGLKTITGLKLHRTDGVSRDRLASRWASLSDDDLNCSGYFVVARK